MQILHGLGEHSRRQGYLDFAESLCAAGFVVYAHDHRGHGATAEAAGAERLAQKRSGLQAHSLSELQRMVTDAGADQAALDSALDSKNPADALVSLLLTFEESSGDEGVFADSNGWQLAVDDAYNVTCMIRDREQRGIPLVLFGHSMGALIGRSYIAQYAHGDSPADTLAGFVCMGSGSRPQGESAAEPSPQIAELLESGGPRARLPMSSLFGPFNTATVELAGEQHTEHDWLSRDPAVGAEYEADPLCCVTQWDDKMAVSLATDIQTGAAFANSASAAAATPSDLPLLILNGERDPVVANPETNALDGSGHQHLVRLFTQEAASTDVSEVLYKDARHELLAELNKEEVVAEIVGFAQRVCGEDAAEAGADLRQQTMGWGAFARRLAGPRLMSAVDECDGVVDLLEKWW